MNHFLQRQLQRRLRSFVFEATAACNHDCLHCYNVRKNYPEYPAGELPTEETLAMLEEFIRQTGVKLVSISGGEPLLRKDIFELVDWLAAQRVSINFLTNGSLLDNRAIAQLTPNKISLFEIPLLSADHAIHDRLSGRDGAFSASTLAIASLKAAGQKVVCVFVATRLNLPTWRETAELAIALGADAIMFNRFNPGGQGAQHVEMLQAGPSELAAALDTAQAIVDQYRISISCSIPMPACLFDHSRWPTLSFGYCAAGTARAYYTLDALGNVRPCNHSQTILGNIRQARFRDMACSTTMRDFMAARPAFCTDCKMELKCQGGCKAAAEACTGSLRQCDPFLESFANQAHKP